MRHKPHCPMKPVREYRLGKIGNVSGATLAPCAGFSISTPLSLARGQSCCRVLMRYRSVGAHYPCDGRYQNEKSTSPDDCGNIVVRDDGLLR